MNDLLSVSILSLVTAILFSDCSHNEKIQLVRNGRTPYTIYADPSAPQSVKDAAEELKIYFQKVTGASPAIAITYQAPPEPFISLGTTSASRAEQIDISQIPDDGFRIVTRGKNLFILGPDTPTGNVNNLGGVCNGTSNGTFTFLEKHLGVEWLMPGDLGEEYSRVRSISIPPMDSTGYSPFNFRVVKFRSPGASEDAWDRHMKIWKVADVSANHSWIETIPPSCFDQHPDWFAQVNGKIIPPSGNYYKLETTNPGLVQAFADVITETFRKNPNQRWYSLAPSDGWGFSESTASLALTEKDPYGGYSVSPLVFKFYNDVARIVGREFPDHKLGGSMYGPYLYPPAAGLPTLESNLALVMTGLTHHWSLYRPNVPEKNDKLMRFWGESSKKDGYDLYWNDYPISLMMPNAIICPPTPDKLNFIFQRMKNYGFKGADIYASGPVWPVFGAGNYLLAKLLWNPDQNAEVLFNKYCASAFGIKAAPHIINLYAVLDTAFKHFYRKDLRAGSSLTEGHLKEIYAAHYPELEDHFLKARAVEKNPKQHERLAMFGQVLSLLQWHLRDNRLLPPDYMTPLTVSAEEIDQIMSVQHKDFQITRRGALLGIMKPEKMPFKVEKTKALEVHAFESKAVSVPLNTNIRMLMHVKDKGEVTINFKDFNGKNEFVRYTLTDIEGRQLKAGVVARGRTISFTAEAGRNYLLDIPSRGADIKMEVTGASIAYKAPGLQIPTRYIDQALPLYFHVPEGTKSFNVTSGTRDAVIDIISPDGFNKYQLKGESRKIIPVNNSGTGFWNIVFHKVEGEGVIAFVLDEHLPPWFIPDPANPLVITPSD
jgi:hypothetical protein